MANHAGHAQLPYPVRGAKFTLPLLYLDATGTPTDPVTPDTEVSVGGAAFGDCAEEATVITGGNGAAWITLTGLETDGNFVIVAGKVASGPKATLAMLYPRWLPRMENGLCQAGAGSATLVLAAGASDVDSFYVGCIAKVRTGATCEARLIVTYVGATRTAGIASTWETTPALGDAYEILMTEYAGNAARANLYAISGDTVAADNLETMLDGTGGGVLSLKQLSIVNNSGSALVAQSTGSQGNGIYAIGHSAGAGILGEGGTGGSAGMALVGYRHGLDAQSVLNGHGINAFGGVASGDGIHAEAQSVGDGAHFETPSGSGLVAQSTGGNGHGIDAQGNGSGIGLHAQGGAGAWFRGAGGAGAGLLATGGPTGHGLEAVGGTTSGDGAHFRASMSGDGLELVAAGGGLPLNPAVVAGGTAPTAFEVADAVWDEPLADHLAAGSTGQALDAAGGAGGTVYGEDGAIEFTYTVYAPDAVTPLPGAAVHVSADAGGTQRSFDHITDALGRVQFHLVAGDAYFWRSHPTYLFEDPDLETVS